MLGEITGVHREDVSGERPAALQERNKNQGRDDEKRSRWENNVQRPDGDAHSRRPPAQSTRLSFS